MWGEKIFLTSALEEGKERLVICLDRESGEVLWQQSAWSGAHLAKRTDWCCFRSADKQMTAVFLRANQGRGGLLVRSLVSPAPDQSPGLSRRSDFKEEGIVVADFQVIRKLMKRILHDSMQQLFR